MPRGMVVIRPWTHRYASAGPRLFVTSRSLAAESPNKRLLPDPPGSTRKTGRLAFAPSGFCGKSNLCYYLMGRRVHEGKEYPLNTQKLAQSSHSVHACIRNRWSPYGFSDRDVSEADLRSLFESARWAASSYNEQPWRFLVARKTDGEHFARVLSCLVEANQAWAGMAPVLVLGCASLRFSRNDQPNSAAIHDLGLASANLTFEATARGLSVHQMIGIMPDKAREIFHIPASVLPVTALAIGYAADPDKLPEKWRERDLAPRSRRPLDEFVFGGDWGKGAAFLG